MSNEETAFERGHKAGYNKTLNTVMQNHISKASVVAARNELENQPEPKGSYHQGVRAGVVDALNKLILEGN